jgi:polar amino acid transport system substrate-binding protein
MKFAGMIGLAAMLVGAVSGGTARADVLADIKARNALICGMSSASPPWGFLDVRTQQIVGYEIDLCNMVGKALGVRVQLKEVSSSARVPEIMQGRIDLLAGLLSYSKERAEQVDFSGAYINESFSFMVLATSEIKTVDELAGKRIGVVAGSFLEPLIPPRLPTARVVAFESQPANFVALQQGKVVGSAMRYSQAKALEANAGASVRPLRALPGALTNAASGFGIRKDEAEWKGFLDQFLAKLESSGEGQVLFDKWLGKDSVYQMQREFRFGQPLTDF